MSGRKPVWRAKRWHERRTGILIVAVAVIVVIGALVSIWLARGGGAAEILVDSSKSQQVVLGAQVYRDFCAVCHDANLKGQPDWRNRKPDGRLPAPPHDETGHTWHHPDDQLFAITKQGLGPFAPPNYQSDMPAFENVLTDEEISAVLAYIKSRWPQRVLEVQSNISRRTTQGGSQ